MSSTWDTQGYDSEKDLEGRQYPKEGQYHLAIQDVDHKSEKAVKAKGLRIQFEVLNGTVPGQVGMGFQQTFKWPDGSHKDGGEFCKKYITKLLIATGYMHPSQLGKRMDIEWTDLVGRQLVCKIKAYKRENDGKVYEGVEIDGLHFWHVNHEDAASVPKDKDALELRPADAPGPEGNGDGKGELVGAGASAAPAKATAGNGAARKDRFANL